MTTHKCDGCRYKGEHQEMGFKPFGVCYKETNLIEAEKNYKAETCPYNRKIIITNAGYDIKAPYKTPYDVKIAEAEQMLRGEEKPAYLPQLYKIEGVDLAEPEQWPKENPYTKPALDILCDFEPLVKGLQEVAAAFEKLVENLKPILNADADVTKKIIDLYPDKRVIYLATHGKGRTRKKNINRISKWYERQGKKPRAKNKKRGFIRYVEENGKKWAVFVTY